MRDATTRSGRVQPGISLCAWRTLERGILGVRAMKIVVLGGAGAMGTAVSADLAACADVTELVVADLDGVKAEALAEAAGGRARAAQLDLADRERALELLRGADVLVNCTSFTLFDEVIELAVAGRGRLRGPDLRAERLAAARGRGGRDHGDLRARRLAGPHERARRACGRLARRARGGTRLLGELPRHRAEPGAPRHDPVGALGRLPDQAVLPERPLRQGAGSWRARGSSTSRRRSAASASTTCRTPR